MRFHAATGGGDGDSSGILKALIAKWAGDESSIQERVERNVHTGATMPLAQSAAGAAGLFAALVGLGILVSQTAELFGYRIVPGDALFLGSVTVFLFLASVVIFRQLASTYNPATIGLLSTALAGLVLLGFIGTVFSRRDELTWWRVALCAAGLVLIVFGLALAYREIADLLDPHGKTSAFERMIRPYLPLLFGLPEPEPEYSRFVPFRRGNGAEVLNIGDGPLGPEDAELLEFARRAASVGLSRRLWLGQTLECTNQPVTRDKFEELVGRLVHLGYVTPGGQGIAARWAVPAAEVVADLEAQVAMQREDE